MFLLQQGLRDCALFVCLLAPTVDFKGLGNGPAARGSMLVQFKYLAVPAAKAVYALSISYGIIKEHGGSIAVTTNPDGGATFLLIRPASAYVNRGVFQLTALDITPIKSRRFKPY